MITEKDIDRLKKVFVTKEEFADLRVEVGEMKETVETINVKIDKFLGTVEEVQLDNQAGAQILYRHSLQIRTLADGTGITLPEQ